MYLSGAPRRPPFVHTISACLREMDLVGVASRTTEHILELRPSVVVSLNERNSNSNSSSSSSKRAPRGGKFGMVLREEKKESRTEAVFVYFVS